MHDKCMSVKTITIDLEAYAALARHKRAGQSFSQVVKEHFGKLKTGADLAEALDQLVVSEVTLDELDRQAKARGRSRARLVRL